MKQVSKQAIANARSVDDMAALSPIDDIIEDIRNGRMVILVDDEDRENEGDLVVAAQFATPDTVNFMATHGRGLICLAMEKQQIQRLGLPPMVQINNAPLSTAFTVSIEARTGVSTGISAPDRARTVQVAIDPTSTSANIVTPGHIFPLQAQDGGTLVRTGHTEAAVDLARLSGLNPSGVICEIMKDDGEMARLPDLVSFAQRHGLKLGTIADLVSYRLRTESHVRLVETRPVALASGDWTLNIFRDTLHDKEILALVKGTFTTTQAVPVKMHSLNPLDDIFGASNAKLQKTLTAITKHGFGVVVLLPGMSSVSSTPSDSRATLRRYGIGAQVLRALNVSRMILITESTKHIASLHGFGIDLIEQKPADAL